MDISVQINQHARPWLNKATGDTNVIALYIDSLTTLMGEMISTNSVIGLRIGFPLNL